MSSQDKILAAASRNAQILNALSEVDYASSSLKQQVKYIQELDREIAQTDAEIKAHENRLNSQRKEHEKYRDSSIRRFAYKVGGKKEKFESDAETEERKYVDSLNAELKVKARRELLGTQLADAKAYKTDLETAVKERSRLQKELDALYKSAFDGPTPDFPEEDAKESEVKQATVVYDQRQEALNAEGQVIKILCQADRIMLRALNEVANALQSALYNIYGYNLTFGDFSERSSLSQAQVAVNQAEMLVAPGKTSTTRGAALPETSIGSGNLVGDILFDQVYPGVDFRRRIEVSGSELLAAAKRLQAEIEAARKREKATKQELAEVAVDLEKSRLALQAVRGETLARVLAGRSAAPAVGPPSDALPSYEDSAAPPSYVPT